MDYDIFLQEKPVGKASVHRNGLYYQIDCSCKLPGDGIYMIGVKSGNAGIKLGICVPVNGIFQLRRRIPVKNLIDGDLSFYAFCTEENAPVECILQEGSPVARIQDLEKSFLRKRGEQYVLVFHDM